MAGKYGGRKTKRKGCGREELEMVRKKEQTKERKTNSKHVLPCG